MEQIRNTSCLGKIGLITSHSLALILISWYSLIQVGVVQYDLADAFGAVLLLSLPVSATILLIFIADFVNNSSRGRLLIWGLVLTLMIMIASFIAWVQLMSFFSSLSGTTFG